MTKSKYTLPLLLAATAVAHDMYIMPSTFRPAAGAIITTGFHVGDSFPDSEVSGRLDRLQNPTLRWQGGSAPIANLRIEGKRDLGDVRLPSNAAGHLIAAVNTLPSLIELAPAKFKSYLEHEGLTDTIAWRDSRNEAAKPGKERYSKYSKALLISGAPNLFYKTPVGYTVEIIPEADPYKLKPGESLPIQVLFRGRPAAGLQIEAAWAGGAGETKSSIAGRTGPDGRLKVPLASAGRWRLHTVKMERCAEPAAADWESFWASLTFELP